MGNEMKNLFNKLMRKLGYLQMSGVNALIEVIKSNTESMDARLKERDETIRKLREEAREEKLLQQRIDDLVMRQHFSRFIEITEGMDGADKILRKVTEEQISHAVDMADCYGEPGKYMYLDDDGKLYPVTFGRVDRPVTFGELDEFYAENPTIIHSQSGAIVANGKVVGHVSYTDH
jgi:hypothetical protein